MTNKERIAELEQRIAEFEQQEKHQNQDKISNLEDKISSLEKEQTPINGSKTIKVAIGSLCLYFLGILLGSLIEPDFSGYFIILIPVILVMMLAVGFYLKKVKHDSYAKAAFRVALYWGIYAAFMFFLIATGILI